MRPAIQYWEERTINGWPSLHTVIDQGWIMRFAEGYTSRANSVSPLYGALDFDEQIERCELEYTQRGLPTLFKLAAMTMPDQPEYDPVDQDILDLDSTLVQRGYVLHSASYLMTAPLDLFGVEASAEQYVYAETLAEFGEWFDTLCGWADNVGRHRSTAETLLSRNPYPLHFAAIYRDDQPAAIGLGVLQNDCFGIYDIVTDPAQRRTGLGRALVGTMMDWAGQHGAHTAYLQVGQDNPGAIGLYDGLGFRIEYSYWYRAIHPTG